MKNKMKWTSNDPEGYVWRYQIFLDSEMNFAETTEWMKMVFLERPNGLSLAGLHYIKKGLDTRKWWCFS